MIVKASNKIYYITEKIYCIIKKINLSVKKVCAISENLASEGGKPVESPCG
jgi:hypothetical protein